MSTSSYNQVVYKDTTGKLSTTPDELSFESEDSLMQVSFPWSNVTKRQSSPASSKKHLMKVILNHGEQTVVFQFQNRPQLEKLRIDIADRLHVYSKKSGSGADVDPSETFHFNDDSEVPPSQRASSNVKGSVVNRSAKVKAAAPPPPIVEDFEPPQVQQQSRSVKATPTKSTQKSDPPERDIEDPKVLPTATTTTVRTTTTTTRVVNNDNAVDDMKPNNNSTTTTTGQPCCSCVTATMCWCLFCSCLVIVVLIVVLILVYFFALGDPWNIMTTVNGGPPRNTDQRYPPDWGYETRYAIRGSEKSFTKDNITVSFRLSDYILDNSVDYTLYDGPNCRMGSNEILPKDNNYLFVKLVPPDDEGANIVTGTGKGSRDFDVVLSMNRFEIQASPLWENVGAVQARLTFCLGISVMYNRVDWWTESQEVNYLENAIQFDVDLTGVWMKIIDVRMQNKVPAVYS